MKESRINTINLSSEANGQGLRAISNHLNKTGKTKRNRHFSINGIAQILDNVVYNGKISWIKIENEDTLRRIGKNPNPTLVKGNMKLLFPTNYGILYKQKDRSRAITILYLNLILQKSTYQRPLHLSTYYMVKRIMNTHFQYPLPIKSYHHIFNNL
ncbi:recombinase family protein [Cytobacillus kochii]|uniref:recombinase family protein n=1 Tax=Cytobacillus kochii TaxID=859143 RepID=UPI00402AD714